MSTTTASATSTTSGITGGSILIILNYETIIWLVIVSVIVVSSTCLVSWLLCSCSCGEKRRRESKRILDDRNDFGPWNAAAEPADAGLYGKGYSNDITLTPLTKAAVRPAGHSVSSESGPREPELVDEELREQEQVPKRNTRYYSGWRDSDWGKRLSKISQIGRAY